MIVSARYSELFKTKYMFDYKLELDYYLIRPTYLWNGEIVYRWHVTKLLNKNIKKKHKAKTKLSKWPFLSMKLTQNVYA